MMDTKFQIEEFRDFHGYRVSNMGRIIGKRGKEMKTHFTRDGYLLFHIRIGNKDCGFLLHRLIGLLFVANDMPLFKTQINHINGIKTDCRASNLEWCSCKHNCREKYALRKALGQPRHTEKEEEGFRKMGMAIQYEGKEYYSINEMARQLSVPLTSLQRAVKKRNLWGKQITVVPTEYKKLRRVEYDGKVFPSLTALAREFGVVVGALYEPLSRGFWRGKPIRRVA